VTTIVGADRADYFRHLIDLREVLADDRGEDGAVTALQELSIERRGTSIASHHRMWG
jgi:hypothetical protein